MLAPDPASILDQIFGRAGIPLTQESTPDDHALGTATTCLAGRRGRDSRLIERRPLFRIQSTGVDTPPGRDETNPDRVASSRCPLGHQTVGDLYLF